MVILTAAGAMEAQSVIDDGHRGRLGAGGNTRGSALSYDKIPLSLSVASSAAWGRSPFTELHAPHKSCRLSR